MKKPVAKTVAPKKVVSAKPVKKTTANTKAKAPVKKGITNVTTASVKAAKSNADTKAGIKVIATSPKIAAKNPVKSSATSSKTETVAKIAVAKTAAKKVIAKPPVKQATPAQPSTKSKTVAKVVPIKAATKTKPATGTTDNLNKEHAVITQKKSPLMKLVENKSQNRAKEMSMELESPIIREYERSGARKEPRNLVAGLEGIAPYKPMEGEAYMSEGQIKHFRIILEAMRRQLMEEVDRTVNDMRGSDKNLSDFTDRATNEEEIFFMLKTRTREGKLLRKIEEALNRLEHHEYGYCDGCGVEVGIRRLEARPTATLCIDCKTLDEIREKQRTL